MASLQFSVYSCSVRGSHARHTSSASGGYRW